MRARFTLNGDSVTWTGEARRSLVDAIRDDLGLKGTHLGCEQGECGACTVLVDSVPVRACLMLAVQADGQDVVTIEGLASLAEGDESPQDNNGLHPAQAALLRHRGIQCGFCTPGMAMALAGVAELSCAAPEQDVAGFLSGQLCRCTGYAGILSAGAELAETAGLGGIEQEAMPDAGGDGGESERFVRGRGRYVSDIVLGAMAHAAILRSSHAHARIRRIDLSAAEALAGVHCVLDGRVLAGMVAPFSHMIPGEAAKPLQWWPLAVDAVRFVGEPVVVAVAISREIAEDALDAVKIEYEDLPAVFDAKSALRADAPLLFPEWSTNEMLHMSWSTPSLDRALKESPRRLRRSFESHRITAAPLEGHGTLADFDRLEGRLTVWASAQQPHQLRSVLAEVCGLAETAVRVVAPDIGGGFGNKQHFTREQALVAALAIHLGGPVRWIEDRKESLTSSIHARAQAHDVDVGYDLEGRVLAIRARIVVDLGNPMLYFSGVGPALVAGGSLTGGYAIPQAGVELSCVATNTCPVGAYRGFGQPEAHHVTEQVMNLVADELGMDPADVRRRNLLPDRPRPWIAPSGALIDTGALHGQLELLLEEAGYVRLRKCQEEARKAGRLVGIGLSSLVEGTAPTQHDVAGRFGSWESAKVSVLPDGSVSVVVGTKCQGQSHRSSFAKLAAEALGVQRSRVRVTEGDTDQLPYGMGTWGSRSTVMGGGAVLRAAREVAATMAKLAAEMGGNPSFDQVAAEAWWHTNRLARGTDPGLTSTVTYTPGQTLPPGGSSEKWSNHDETYASHMTAVVVEVHPTTGKVDVLEAVVVSDCGQMIDPEVVKGQLQGGFAQGLGAVLLEEVLYDSQGRPAWEGFSGYSIPQAGDVPQIRVVFRSTPSETEGGFRGVGEAGTIFTPAAMVGAVNDALAPFGIWVDSTRLHPRHLRPLLRKGLQR